MKRVNLGDVADLLTGFPFPSDKYTDEPSAPRLLRGDNVAQGLLRWDGAKRWPSTLVGDLGKYLLRPGDVIVAMDRPWIEAGLKFASVQPVDCPCLLVQRVARLRGAEGHLSQGFLRYLIGSPRFTEHVLAVQTGTTVPHISGTQILSFEFDLPPLADQEATSEVLLALDDKIELNRRTNETLEGMARALFKSWFVGFDPVRAKAEGRAPVGMDAATAAMFPNSIVGAEGLPRGWQHRTLRDVTSVIRRGLAPVYLKDGGVCVLNQKCIRGNAVDNSKARRHDASARPTEGRELRVGDVLVNSTGVGTLGRVAPVRSLAEKTVVDSHVTVVRADPSILDPDLLGIALATRESEIEALGEGSTGQTELSRERLGLLPILVPTPDVQQAFTRVSGPLGARISTNEAESRTLAELRDLLLPKLLSGELRVRDAEKVVGQVA